MLDSFKSSNNPFIKEMADKLDNYADMYKNGQLSQDEYKDLVNDVTNLENIHDLANDAILKQEVRQAATAMIEILEKAAGFVL